MVLIDFLSNLWIVQWQEEEISPRGYNLLSETWGFVGLLIKEGTEFGIAASSKRDVLTFQHLDAALLLFEVQIMSPLLERRSFSWCDFQEKAEVKCQSLERKCLFSVDPLLTIF